ncbi:MAG: response regulator transcription factor [Myxococcales bacterium]|nr:response regulator transcription factor [Myxococcales bacterium]
MRVLLVEDDRGLARATSAYLEGTGMQVDVLHDGAGVVDRVLADPPDVVVLDIELPGESGLSICRRLRDLWGGRILMLTGRKSEMDEVIGLELGADDYVAKPAAPRVLELRIRALARRNGAVAAEDVPRRTDDTYADADLQVDRSARQVSVHGVPVDLTAGELDLLWLLAENVGAPVTREMYYGALHGADWDGEDRGLDGRMSKLRRKLLAAGLPSRRITTIRSVGYQLTTTG